MYAASITSFFPCTNTCEQNTSNILYNIREVMSRDPSRRFAFGITVEDTNMRIWFCSRGSPIVSKAFDFTSVSFHARICCKN